MTERPILFSAPMVRAILDGRKTQTRRIMKVQPPPDALVTVEHYHPIVIDRHGDMQPGDEIFGAHWDDGEFGLKSPYGAPGDTLWVRETWGAVWPADEPVPLRQCEIEYRAELPPGCTDRPGEWPADEGNGPEVPKWRPSIHMPRWASRITLRITDIRVERLQDISEDDARAEGVSSEWDDYEKYGQSEPYRYGFSALWNDINGPGAWDDNPWVWAISFERVKP
jgi:hypothetical protein